MLWQITAIGSEYYTHQSLDEAELSVASPGECQHNGVVVLFSQLGGASKHRLQEMNFIFYLNVKN